MNTTTVVEDCFPATARRQWRTASIVLVSLSLAGLSAPAAQAEEIALPLAGEQLQDSLVDPDSEFEATCNPDGTSTIHYRVVDGVASGPYPGTFDEQGTITVGPQVNESIEPGLFINDFATGDAVIRATFTIDSPFGQVSGTKSTPAVFEGDLSRFPLPEGSTGQGVCQEFSGEIEGRPFRGSEAGVVGGLHYEARITTPTGTFRDSGTSTLYLFYGENVGAPPNLFDGNLFIENFLTSDGVVRLLPTSREQCLGRGFKDFPGFKNQGDCVAFVETDGRNEPGRNVPGR